MAVYAFASQDSSKGIVNCIQPAGLQGDWAANNVTSGTTIIMQAIPNSGYVFDYWQGTGSWGTSTANPYTFVMPVSDLTLVAYFAVSSGGAVGKINAVRVQDIERQMWFNWNNGSWDNVPSIAPGVGNLYIAFNAVNTGTVAGNLILTIKESSSGIVLATVTVYTVVGGNAGIEWTGTMPTTVYNISCTCSP